MFVTIDELEKGDEILIPCQVNFKRLKLAVTPSKNKEGNWKNVKCHVRNDNINGSYSKYNAKNPEYNDFIYSDLHYREIWMIKKAESC